MNIAELLKKKERYELFCNSVRGSGHVRKGIPCEDYGIKKEDGEYKIFAVADGHGDPNCVRSGVGSRFACEIAAAVLDKFARQLRESGKEALIFDATGSGRILSQLKGSIVSRWLSAVDSEYKDNPLTSEEIRTASKLADEFRRNIRTERMYGTTLIAGLLTDSYLLLLQQGDGRCVLFSENGEASQPIPWDDRCLGTATTSMCDVDAAQSIRSVVINLAENPVIACVAGTDGVEDSFPNSMDKTVSYYRRMLTEACGNGVEAMESALTEDLSALSKAGSADDITVAGFIDVKRTRKFIHDFDKLNRIIDAQDELSVVNDRIQSVENGGLYAFLSQKYSDAMSVYSDAKEKFDAADVKYKAAARQIAAHESEEMKPEAHDDNETVRLKNIINDMRLDEAHLAPLRRELKKLEAERDSAAQTLAEAETPKKAAEKEFLPRREAYDKLIEEKEKLTRQLEKLTKTDR